MIRTLASASALALILSACTGGEEADAPEVETIDLTDDESASDTADTETEDTAEAGDAGDDAAADKVAALDGIPAKFHGRWDATTGTCAPESDGRMEISAKEVTFYESIGTVEAVETQGDGVKVSLAMEGEGEEWDAAYVFTLNGDKLQSAVVGTPDGAFTRKRCS